MKAITTLPTGPTFSALGERKGEKGGEPRKKEKRE